MRQAYQNPYEPFLPQWPWKELCLIQPKLSHYFIPQHVIYVGKSFSKWAREARFCSHLHYLIISVDLITTNNSLQCTWCQSIPEGLSSQPKTWQSFPKSSASFHFPGNLFSNPLLRWLQFPLRCHDLTPLQKLCSEGTRISHRQLCPVGYGLNFGFLFYFKGTAPARFRTVCCATAVGR